ncbi:MAG: type II toxin-antitoxin system mRNA interferase toxin, RelE/StbE family [Crocosphaera sp.]|nr:type II toxin-antitoxin system mRNA interferase toxin, RelE/StbE family [Crocosphaera sp.]
MNLQFESQFAKDLKNIKDKNLLSKIKNTINQCKTAQNLREIKNLKKLKGYQSFYRLKIGDYRIGIEADKNQLIFVRFLHRKEIYRFFP